MVNFAEGTECLEMAHVTTRTEDVGSSCRTSEVVPHCVRALCGPLQRLVGIPDGQSSTHPAEIFSVARPIGNVNGARPTIAYRASFRGNNRWISLGCHMQLEESPRADQQISRWKLGITNLAEPFVIHSGRRTICSLTRRP